MESGRSERSPLGTRSVPRYTFLGQGNPPKEKFKTSRCCICSTVVGVILLLALVTALAIGLSYLNSGFAGRKSSNASEGLDGLLQLHWPLREESYGKPPDNSTDEASALRTGVEGLRVKDLIEEVQPSLMADSPAFRHQLAMPTTPQAQEMSRRGFLLNVASKEIGASCDNTTRRTAGKARRWAISKPSEWLPREEYCNDSSLRCTPSPYRTANGTCNNLRNPTWGAALHPFRRILLPKYYDGIYEPRRASNGSDLPSAREVSLAIHRPLYRNDVNFTVMLAVWGQFIDHDITATAISKGKNGSSIKCCDAKYAHPECFPVLIGPSDPFYLQRNVTCMEFVRSAPAPTCTFGPREQLNQVTSFLDGSVVYGNSDDEMNQLRTFTGGKLKVLKTTAGDLLPISEDLSDGCNRKEEFERGRYCFLSGDKRSNENLLLTSMHLLFVRYHNFIAENLKNINPHWSDEKLFQETRKIVSAEIQHITYNEFLPSVLPEELMLRLNISTRSSGQYNIYNSSVNPTVANVFAAAAFRFGHTLLPVRVIPKTDMTNLCQAYGITYSDSNSCYALWQGLLQYWKYNSTREEYLELHKMLFNPFETFEEGFLEKFMTGVLSTSSAKSDVYFTPEVTQKLFVRESGKGCGLDLVSLNIQRGRDHGLPSYPNWRTACGLRRPKNFEDLKGDMDEDTLNKLGKLYRSVDDLDLYTGGLAEKPVAGGLVGPTITCLLADQFLRLKIGDRFWYERKEGLQRFKPEQLNEIRKGSLAKVICTTSGVTQSQPSVMRRAGVGNELKFCHELSYPDLGAWREI